MAENIRTRNIKKIIKEFAAKNSLSLSQCDFTLNSIETHIRDRSEESFKLTNEDFNTIYQDKNKILNEHVEFKQVYNITPKQTTNKRIRLNYSIDFAENATHPKIIINQDSIIPYQSYKPQEIYTLLVREINKIKAENLILINFLDASMLKNLKAFIKHIYLGKFTKKIQLPLFDGIQPEVTRESRLIFWYKENNKNNQVIEVEAGEVLVEFIKPIYGKNGFNAFGEEISSRYANNKEDLQEEIDTESIEVVEEVTKKLYISKKKGYVTLTKNTLSVSNKINMQRLSRNNSSVASQENNNIEVLVSQHDTNRDSIGAGVELTSETIHINGHVGANSILEAVSLIIDGATHKDSSQFAKSAQINRHKGTLRCHDAKISLLEGGEVHATNVFIEASLGGSIYAQNVTIGHVKNNLKVYASDSITVKLISGEDNLLKINYLDIPILVNRINFIKNDIEELRESLEEAKRHDLTSVPVIQNKIKELKQEYDAIKHSAKKAKITIENPLRGLNTIIFTIDKENELVFKTEARSYEPFHLEITEDTITLIPTNKRITLKS